MAFLSDLATNATAHNMTVVIYSGNDDSLIPHLGSQSKVAHHAYCNMAHIFLQ